MSKPLASAGTTANVLLTDAQSAAIAAKEKYKTHAKWRLRLAYVLKAIALFGGLFVATVKIDPTVPGIIISAAVILDQLTSNHRRMLADTTAASAIDRTERRVGNAYNDKITAIVAAIEKGGGPDAEALLTTLVSDSAKALLSQR